MVLLGQSLTAYCQSYYPNDSTICLSKNRYASIILTGTQYKERFEIHKKKADSLTVVFNIAQNQLTLVNTNFNLCQANRTQLESIILLNKEYTSTLEESLDKANKNLKLTQYGGILLIILLLTSIIVS